VPSEGRPNSIAFIGAGNMASAIVGGLLDAGYASSRIAVADPSRTALENMRALTISRVSSDARDVVVGAELIILAVKPQVMAEVTAGLKGALEPSSVVMSVAAGISVASLQDMLGNPNAPIVRCMPNTPALVRMGAAGLFASAEVTEAQRTRVEAVMRCVGTTLWVEEEQLLEAVTAVSGSGPAYFFAFMEAMIAKGEQLGLSHDQATALTLRTALGAATLAEEQNIAIDVLRRQVTSPGGTTEQALASFSASGLNTVVADAMQACFDRALTMAKEFK